jgi:hypothetical protein
MVINYCGLVFAAGSLSTKHKVILGALSGGIHICDKPSQTEESDSWKRQQIQTRAEPEARSQDITGTVRSSRDQERPSLLVQVQQRKQAITGNVTLPRRFILLLFPTSSNRADPEQNGTGKNHSCSSSSIFFSCGLATSRSQQPQNISCWQSVHHSSANSTKNEKPWSEQRHEAKET